MSTLTSAAALPDALTTPTLVILPWLDPVVESVGHDPRSPYVERFWLGVLGPSTTWFLRHVATTFDVHPDGFELDTAEVAGALGLAGKLGRDGVFTRTLARSITFGLAAQHPYGLQVRRMLPPVSQRLLARLPATVQEAHRTWATAERAANGAIEQQRRRARSLALSLVELGDDAGTVHDQLRSWRFPPATVDDAISWALARSYGSSGEGAASEPPTAA